MNGEQLDLVLSRLENIDNNVTYLRDRTDDQGEDITELKVDVGSLKTRNAIIKWGAGLLLPLLFAGSIAMAAHILAAVP